MATSRVARWPFNWLRQDVCTRSVHYCDWNKNQSALLSWYNLVLWNNSSQQVGIDVLALPFRMHWCSLAPIPHALLFSRSHSACIGVLATRVCNLWQSCLSYEDYSYRSRDLATLSDHIVRISFVSIILSYRMSHRRISNAGQTRVSPGKVQRQQ